MKNLAYIRTSSIEQTPELQLKDLFNSFPNIEFKVYKEKLSAYKENVKREVFDEIIALIKKGKVDNIYVWDLDRIYRNRLRLKEFFQLCKIHNTKIHSVNQDWLESINSIQPPFNDIMFEMLISIFGWIGEEESSKRSARVRMAVVKKDGKKTVSHKGNKWGRKSLPKQTIDRVIALKDEGFSIREIAERVLVYDKNRNGKNISKSAVHKILAQNTH